MLSISVSDFARRVRVERTVADVVAGRDPELEAALRLVRRGG